MLNKRLILSIGSFLLCVGVAFAQTEMTDQQVLDYVRQGLSEGKQNEEVLTELSLRGVKSDQIQRVRRLYRESQKEMAADAGSSEDADNRSHSVMGSPEVDAFLDKLDSILEGQLSSSR